MVVISTATNGISAPDECHAVCVSALSDKGAYIHRTSLCSRPNSRYQSGKIMGKVMINLNWLMDKSHEISNRKLSIYLCNYTSSIVVIDIDTISTVQNIRSYDILRSFSHCRAFM